MVFFCILGSIFLGIVIGVWLFCSTKRGSVVIDIDIRQDDGDEEEKKGY